MGGLEGVEERSLAEHGAALVVFLCIIALKFVPFLVQLPCEVGLCCPPRLVGGLFLVVQEFGLEQATGIHMGHKVFHLVIVGDRDPMVFTLYLAPVQLACEGFGVRFGSVTLQRNEVGLDVQLLLGGNDIPRLELCDHRFYDLVFVPNVVLLQFLGTLRVDRRDDGFEHH